MYYGFYKNINQYNHFQHNKKCFFNRNQYIRMISEGPCYTEDWSNDFWKFSFAITGINYIFKYIHVENRYFNCNSISQYYSFYCIFD